MAKLLEPWQPVWRPRKHGVPWLRTTASATVQLSEDGNTCPVDQMKELISFQSESATVEIEEDWSKISHVLFNFIYHSMFIEAIKSLRNLNSYILPVLVYWRHPFANIPFHYGLLCRTFQYFSKCYETSRQSLTWQHDLSSWSWDKNLLVIVC